MSELGEKLIGSVRQKALEKPDYVYDENDGDCVYVLNGRPSCLIGHALWDNDVIDESLENTMGHNGQGFFGLAWDFDLQLDEDESRWLNTVQIYQDGEQPWGEATRMADELVGHL